MAARAGIVVTGTEVLTARIVDRNGPWLSERLLELGVDVAEIVVVGDRRDDMREALAFLAGQGADLIVTSGGLGPTADDITVEVVAAFAGRPLELDDALEARIAQILAPLRRRWPQLDEEAIRESNRKQAFVPHGATTLEPVGTAPGFVVPPTDGERPTIVVLPGPPRELQPMWRDALGKEAMQAALAGATTYRQGVLRLFGIPESEIAATLRAVEEDGLSLAPLEITTCLRRGELEVVTRYEPGEEERYQALADAIRARHGATLFSDDGSTIDEQVARLLAGHRIAVAESCTGGLLAARLTDRPGSSAYMAGGVVAYSDAAKVALVGVDAALIERHGAVSPEVAAALAEGAIARFDADVGAGVTGVAGPDGGTAEKPVGRVDICVAMRGSGRIARELDLPGGRADVRDRATTVTMHLLRRLLLGESDDIPS